MAVITQTTFNPLNDFVRVRLGQGVPIVDADVNERDDIHMFELRAALRWFVGEGVPDGSDAFEVVGTGALNDITIRAGVSAVPAGASPEERALRHVGRCLVDGLDVAIAADVAFKAQALHVSQGAPATALAAALGVPTIAEMPVLAGTGTVVVYLDVWERLVTPTEFPALVLPGLGTESCARVKREWVVRVRTGTKAPVPGDADYQTGHGYYALATLARRAGDEKVNADDVTDRRQTGLTLLALVRRIQELESRLRATVTIVLTPILLPFDLRPQWSAIAWGRVTTGDVRLGSYVEKPREADEAWGILPLSLPNGVRLTQLKVLGEQTGTGNVKTSLIQEARTQPFTETPLVTITGFGDVATITGRPAVDGTANLYYLRVVVSNAAHPSTVRFRGCQLTYRP
jgi:hypothetical protein